MAYTHDFEIKVDGITIEGEMSFGNGEEPKFKTTSGEEMTISQHGYIQNLMHELEVFSKSCAEIEKIEVTKK